MCCSTVKLRQKPAQWFSTTLCRFLIRLQNTLGNLVGARTLPPPSDNFCLNFMQLFLENCGKIIGWWPLRKVFIKSLADPRGALWTLSPSLGPISFIFMQFMAKILSNNRFLAQTQELAPLPFGKSWIRH